MTPIAPPTLPLAAQAEFAPFFPSLGMSDLSALPSELVARHVAAIEDREVQRAAVRYQIAVGNYVARAAARSVIDRAVEAGASGPAIVALIDAQTAAVHAEVKTFDAERSRADARRKAFNERTQELRSAVSRRLTRAKEGLPKLLERLASERKSTEKPVLQKIVDLGIDVELAKKLGIPDTAGDEQRARERMEREVQAMREEIPVLEAFNRDGDPAILADLGFDDLIAAQRAVEGTEL